MKYFINEQYLRENTIVGENIQAADVTPHIRIAAKSYVEKWLGTYFFNYMLGLYNNGGANANETQLLEFITDAVGLRLAQRYGTIATFKLTDKGYQKQNGVNSNSIELDELNKIENQYGQDANTFEQALTDFLWPNRKNYPQFMDDLNNNSLLKNCNSSTDSVTSYFNIV